MSIRIKFCGGAGTVTGSNHLIQTDKSQVLLDAGIFYGHRDEYYAVNSKFSYNPAKINAVVLSHAHIDHCGNIPTLIKRGLRSKVFTTRATKDLCRLMLADSGKIQEEDIEFVNKINRRKNLPARKPLYTQKDAHYALRFFRGVSYFQKITLCRDMECIFFDAGHILGSALSLLKIRDKGRTIKLGYIVDLGRPHLPLLNDPYIIKDLDYLIIESTYGNREHHLIEEAKDNLMFEVNQTISRGGKIIIPSFALERTQEVLYFLNKLIKEKNLPAIPIYVDSPLAIGITEVFRQHQDYLDKETKEMLSRGIDPFPEERITYITKSEDSKKLNKIDTPMIIIAGSGMCESGRVLHHLKNNISNPKNTILVVGYMAKDTLGKRLVDREPVVRIFGEDYELRAEVAVINSFSGHADKNDLMDYVKSSDGKLKKIFVVHGDLDQSEAFCLNLQREGYSAHLPKKDEEWLLE